MKKTELQKRYKRNQNNRGRVSYALRTSYEFSPKVCESILQTAKTHLLRDKLLKEGQIEITIIGIDERSKKFVEKMERERVILTLENGMEDIQIMKEYGRVALRQIRIQRITDEAIEQDCIMSQKDLGRVLNCDTRTIQRDIRAIRKRGIDVITQRII